MVWYGTVGYVYVCVCARMYVHVPMHMYIKVEVRTCDNIQSKRRGEERTIVGQMIGRNCNA